MELLREFRHADRTSPSRTGREFPMNLSDISTRLGLSVSTISRALRNAEGVDSKTRSRVVAEAARSGYKGRGNPKGGKTRTFLALCRNDAGTIPSGVMEGMSQAAIELNVSILTHQTPHDTPESILNPKLQPLALRAGQVDGIVLLHEWPEAVVAKLQQMLPVVSLLLDYSDVDVAGIDAMEGMETLVKHLNRTRPGPVGYFGHCRDSAFSGHLYAAFTAVCPDLNAGAHVELTSKILSGKAPLEAVSAEFCRHAKKGIRSWVCPDAACAELLAEAGRSARLDVPADLSVAVFQPAIRPSASSVRWTSLEVPAEDLGIAAVRRLLNRMEAPAESVRRILLKTRLAVGETTPEVVRA
jgi:LacI family transcriptional regulator